MARPTKRTPKKDAMFFEQLARNGIVGLAAEYAGYRRESVYEYRRNDPEFAQKWDHCIQLSTEKLEAEAIRRANEGVKRYVLHKGKVVYIDVEEPVKDEKGKIVLGEDGKPKTHIVQKALVEHVYSDTLTIFMLKARKPEVYRDTFEKVKTLDEPNVDDLTDAELGVIARQLQEKQ